MSCFYPNKLPFGVYRIYWRTGGSSLASVGQTYDGTRWMAPCNWTTGTKEAKFEATTDWSHVSKVELIEVSADREPPFEYHLHGKYTVTAIHPVLGNLRKKTFGYAEADRIADAAVAAGYINVKIAAK